MRYQLILTIVLIALVVILLFSLFYGSRGKRWWNSDMEGFANLPELSEKEQELFEDLSNNKLSEDDIMKLVNSGVINDNLITKFITHIDTDTSKEKFETDTANNTTVSQEGNTVADAEADAVADAEADVEDALDELNAAVAETQMIRTQLAQTNVEITNATALVQNAIVEKNKADDALKKAEKNWDSVKNNGTDNQKKKAKDEVADRKDDRGKRDNELNAAKNQLENAKAKNTDATNRLNAAIERENQAKAAYQTAQKNLEDIKGGVTTPVTSTPVTSIPVTSIPVSAPALVSASTPASVPVSISVPAPPPATVPMAARIKEERELEREQAREEKEEPERQTKEERELQREQVREERELQRQQAREERRDQRSQNITKIQSTDVSVGIESPVNMKTPDTLTTVRHRRPGRPVYARPASTDVSDSSTVVAADKVLPEYSERRAQLVVDPFCGTWKCEYASKL